MHPDPYERDPYQPAQQYVPYPVVVTPPPTSGQAVASLILGIFSVLGGSCLIVPPFLAVWYGHGATRETRTGKRGGHGMAVAGLILGYVGVVGWVCGALFWGVGLIGVGLEEMQKPR